MKTYDELLNKYGPQGWWPLIDNKTLICQYSQSDKNISNNKFEVAIGAILTQNTQWYPNVIRAVQQLKLLRALKDDELLILKKSEYFLKNKEKRKTKNITFKNIKK